MSKLPQARTRATVDRMLAKPVTPRTTDMFSSPYLSCKYDAFNSMSGMQGALPDGRGKNIIVRDFKSTYDISAAGPMFLRISPTFPTPLRVWHQSPGTTINGTSVPSWGAVTATTGQWFGSGQLDQYVVNTAVVSPYTIAASARIINVAYRLVYTGTAASASGVLLVDAVPEKVDIHAPSNPLAITFYDSANTATAAAANAAEIVTIETTTVAQLSGAAPKDQYITRPEAGVHGILKSRVPANNREYKPYFDKGQLPLSDGTTINLASAPLKLAAGQAYGPNVWDDQLEAVSIQITKAGDYRLEILLCMENEMMSSSPLIDLAYSSPKPNHVALALDDQHSAGTVIVKPLGQPLVNTIGGRNSTRPSKPNNAVTPSANNKPKSKPKRRKRRNRQPRSSGFRR
jgi:hypothetical protein